MTALQFVNEALRRDLDDYLYSLASKFTERLSKIGILSKSTPTMRKVKRFCSPSWDNEKIKVMMDQFKTLKKSQLKTLKQYGDQMTAAEMKKMGSMLKTSKVKTYQVNYFHKKGFSPEQIMIISEKVNRQLSQKAQEKKNTKVTDKAPAVSPVLLNVRKQEQKKNTAKANKIESEQKKSVGKAVPKMMTERKEEGQKKTKAKLIAIKPEKKIAQKTTKTKQQQKSI